MDSTRELKTKLSSLKLQLKKHYPIASMAIFGSYARNEQTTNSDVDILVELDGRIGIKFIDLANELEKALGLKVDLVSKKGIKDRYFKAIQSDLIYV
ncbi:nucleotidyltransferase family protein [Flagellimonas sp.]|uniref:nucleotidyltransferase family protein n=1 Tax=Flagellimonas sp. TaxID=2058762 RepID=UPI003BAEA5C1